MTGSRPGGVTLVAVLVWILGLFNLIVGILTLVGVPLGLFTLHLGFAASSLGSGLLGIVWGVILFFVAFALLRGSRVARVVVTIMLVVNLIGAVVQLVGGGVVGGIVNLAIAIVGILLLWSGRAAAYFRR